MRGKPALMVVMLVAAGRVLVQQGEDPALAAALAQCPGAVAFVQAHGLARRNPAAIASTAPASEPALRAQLLDMARVDQAARSGDWSPAAIQRMNEVDADHLPKIKRVVAGHGGLPDAGQVGADGVAAAWLQADYLCVATGLMPPPAP